MESPPGRDSPQPARDGFTSEDAKLSPRPEQADSEESRVASADTLGESSSSLPRSSEEADSHVDSQADSHGDDFAGAQDNSVVTEFLPINGEIKKMGVEISEEQAEQLKNDIRRLSPEVVSLRERTLGEISLTPDSSFHKSDEDKSVESSSQSRSNKTVRYNLSPIVLLDRISQYSPQLWQPVKSSPDTNSPKTRSQSQAEERILRINSETMQSTTVAGSANGSYSTTPTSRRTVSKMTVDESNAKMRLHRDVPVTIISNEHHGSSVKCGASIITDVETKSNESLIVAPPSDEEPSGAATQSKSLGDEPQSLKAVIRQLGEDEEVIFSTIPNQSSTDVGSCVTHVQAFVKTASPSNVDLSNSLSQKTQVSEIKDDSASADIEMDTETDSDSSEVMASMSAVHLTESRTSDANDPPGSGDASPEILTRLEPEQPDAFTEDSAESLALTATARDEVRSDGSDSGLGGEISGDPGPTPAPESDSETSFLDRIPDEILSIKEKAPSHLEAFEPCVDPSAGERPRPMLPHQMLSSPTKSNLKRRLAECIDGEPLAKRSNPNETEEKKKRNIQFDAVTVYYFPRAQGFTCVPSQGGSTLGMSAAHTHAERFSLSEHAAEQRRIHRARLAQLRTERAANNVVEAASSSEDPSDDTDEEPSDTDELDIDSYYFLLPVPTWQRRALLRAAGVQKIDTVEKDECRDIRASRKHCGCGCKGYCDPESCPCSRAHVKCQVDRAGFPCGCSRDGCANSSGRIEFNPVRVRTHFIHTLMRLELEKKQREEDNELAESQRAIRERRLPAVMDSCNPGNAGFTTLHYTNSDATTSSCQGVNPGIREDSLDLYAIRDDCYPNDETVDGIQQQRKLHPEFNQAFQTFPVGSVDSPVFRQTNYHQDYQAYQQLPSTSRAHFQPQFQPVAETQEFAHYGTYPPDVAPTINGQNNQTSNYQTNNFPQDDGTASQYTNLNSVQNLNNVQQMGKLEPFSELLAGRYSYYGEVESQHHENYDVPAKNDAENNHQDGTQQTTSQDDCDDNFGEIIKKSMVETVSA